jgi:CubicO group peptidase (beta-lactamase class C family)
MILGQSIFRRGVLVVALAAAAGMTATHAEAENSKSNVADASKTTIKTATETTIAAEIDRFLSPYFNPDEPGATVIVTRDGKPIFRKAYGLADMEKKTRLEPEMVMRIASMTKQFTAVAIMTLVDQGKLKLDDDIALHLPDYPKQKKKITIDNLLTHTSGIPGYTELPSFEKNRDKEFSVAQMVDTFQNEPLLFAPGSKMRYSNSGYFLLGTIIERHSGMSYADYMAKNVFEPLGMKDTAYEGQERSGKKRVNGYKSSGYKGGIKIEFAAPLSNTQPYAAGSLVSTVDDLAKWDAAIAEGKLLKPESWQKLFEPINVLTGNAMKVARGWFATDIQGAPARWHSGGIQGFMSDGIRLPNEKVYAAMLVNTESPRVNPTILNQRIAAIVIGKPYGFAGIDTPFYLRGTMNEWGTTHRVRARGANEFVVEVDLKQGDHEFKFGSEDWAKVDFGGGPPDSRVNVGQEMPMSLTGANVKLTITEKARYRFVLNTADALWPKLRVEKKGDETSVKP